MQQGRQLFFLPWGASIRDTYPEHRVEHIDALKGLVHPQNDFFSIDYSCLGGVGNWRPGGHMRPSPSLNVALRLISQY